MSVHEKFLEWNAKRMVVLGRYDPNVVIERHGHASDHLVYVLEGKLNVGDRSGPPGTLIVLEVGAKFGRSSPATRVRCCSRCGWVTRGQCPTTRSGTTRS